MFNLEEELKNLPEKPGVYLMHANDGTIIYVGKAKILKNRVRQYFRNLKSHTPKVRAMVSNISYFEYIITGTELEALVLECNLIKKYRPKYNILLKDDKSYPYIKVNMQKDYPNIEVTRVLKNDGAKYFGPYIGKGTIKNNMEIVQKIFRQPICNRKFPQDIGKGRPCLNYHINNCFAPCTGRVSKEEYRSIYEEICTFLEGGHKKLVEEMTRKMNEASAGMEFELAASLRDKIRAINLLDEKQRIINSDKQTDLDMIGIGIFESRAFVEAFFIRGGKILGRESYALPDAETEKEALQDFVKQFYADAKDIPGEILLSCDIDDRELIEEWLFEKRGKKVKLLVPQRGKKADLMRLCEKNVEQAILNYRAHKQREAERYSGGEKLAELLGLKKAVRRIEAYDISNISGAHNVAGMVVFQNGKPYKKGYRKFKIKSFEGADDYGAMREVIYRRFRNALDEEEQIEKGGFKAEEAKFLPYPDVIFVDGGAGQITAAKSMLEEIELDIPVFGMVKNDKHKTRGLLSSDGKAEINMTSAIFNFITQIQDEVHRYAIGYHKKLRSRALATSELDKISGVGEKKRKLLLSKFKTVANVAKATEDELKSAGIDTKTAENIYYYFNREE